MVPLEGPHSQSSKLRFLLSHNPLYLISAWLVLHGIGQAFAGGMGVGHGLLMTQLLCSYTLVLALSGWVVVRFGKAWEDARTILLILLLMFTGISVSYDELCLREPFAGAWNLAIGLVFCWLISESLLWSLKVQLPVRFRIPFYLQLCVLFAFPAILGKLSHDGRDIEMCVGVLLFPVISGISLLTLLPAASQRPQRDQKYGTPWSWPWYPWSIYVFMATAFAIRAWMLSVSFSPAYFADPAFQLYFLCPILLAGIVILLEIGLRIESVVLQQGSLASMFLVLGLAFPGTGLNFAQQKLVELLEGSLAGPPLLVALAVAAIAVYAMLRRASGSELVAILAIAFAGCLDANTRSFAAAGTPHAAVLILLAGWLFVLGLRTRGTWRLAAGGVAVAFLLQRQFAEIYGSEITFYWASQLGIAWCAVVPLIARDALAKWLQRTGPLWLALLAAAEFGGGLFWTRTATPWTSAIAVTALAGLVSLYWIVCRQPRYVITFAWSTILATILWLNVFLQMLGDTQLRRGLASYFVGYGVLAVALLMSFWKSGLVRRFWKNFEVAADTEYTNP